jgi:hypothetical protein
MYGDARSTEHKNKELNITLRWNTNRAIKICIQIVNCHLIFDVTHFASTGINKFGVKWHVISFYLLLVSNIPWWFEKSLAVKWIIRNYWLQFLEFSKPLLQVILHIQDPNLLSRKFLPFFISYVVLVGVLWARESNLFQKHRSHTKIHGARVVKCSKFHASYVPPKKI